jgi:hypothetical protein
MNNLPDIINNKQHPIFDAIQEIQQPRSKFQLENFVLNQHDTDEMKYYQCVLELQNLITSYRKAELEREKLKIEILRLESSSDEIDNLDAKIKQIDLDNLDITMFGAKREIELLAEFWQSFPIKYTREQIEINQRDYWTKRLTRQAEAQAIGSGKIDWAQIDSMNQAGILGQFIQNFNEKKQIENI